MTDNVRFCASPGLGDWEVWDAERGQVRWSDCTKEEARTIAAALNRVTVNEAWWAEVDAFYAALDVFVEKERDAGVDDYHSERDIRIGAEWARQYLGLNCGANVGGTRNPCVLPPGHAQLEHQALDRNMFLDPE